MKLIRVFGVFVLMCVCVSVLLFCLGNWVRFVSFFEVQWVWCVVSFSFWASTDRNSSIICCLFFCFVVANSTPSAAYCRAFAFAYSFGRYSHYSFAFFGARIYRELYCLYIRHFTLYKFDWKTVCFFFVVFTSCSLLHIHLFLYVLPIALCSAVSIR